MLVSRSQPFRKQIPVLSSCPTSCEHGGVAILSRAVCAVVEW